MPRILVVDDNSQNLYFLEVLLKANGYEVSTAHNGAEALDSALASPPDLVISDLLMPVMDGFSLCYEWKMSERLAAIPFVVYTATYTDQKDEELAASLGADRYVKKPQEPELLLQVIRDVLSESRAGGARKTRNVPPEEAVRLKKYSEALFRKLGKKLAELETTNRELERAVAERTRGEEALRASEAKYRIVADNTHNWEFWCDPDGAYRYVSPSCRQITGHDREEFVRDPGLLERLIHPEDWPGFSAHRDDIEKRKRQGNIEFRIVRADGSQRWIAHDCLPVFDEREGWLGTRGSNRDITEQKRLEAQLLQAQKMEVIGRLAGGIAHDFNNILTAILGYTSILERRTTNDETLRDPVNEIATAAERASNLTNSLLMFSRKRDVKLQSVDLNDLVRNIEKFLGRIIGEHIQIHTALSQEAANISADSGQVEQILMNLAVNARDAIQAEGILTVKTESIEIDDQYIRLHGYGAPGRYVMLSVSDNGIGMDETTRQRIFEPFFTTKEAGKGTGLGLSIVYGIVKQHGGYVDVYSEPGRGTTFRLLFPNTSAEPSAQQTKGREALVSPARGSETILVVDDDAGIRSVLEMCLTSLGYTVILAEDGQDAIEKFRENTSSIDLVVMDTIMPKKSGNEVLLELRAFRHDVRVLLMSGYPPETVQARGLLPEGVEFVQKPVGLLLLGGKVRDILDRT